MALFSANKLNIIIIIFNIRIITRIRLQGHEHILAGVIFIMRELKYSNKYTYA